MLIRKPGSKTLVNLEIDYSLILHSWYSMYDIKFLESDYMRNLMTFLYLEYDIANNNIIRPTSKLDVFKPFAMTEMDDCHTVIVFEYPTVTRKGSGLGIGNDTFLHRFAQTPEFSEFRKVIEDTLYDKKINLAFDITLRKAAKEGTLFLNSALTCIENDNRAHVNYWEKFISETISRFEEMNAQKVFIFIGEACKFANLVDPKYHYVLTEEKSLDEYVKNKKEWHTNVFKEANEFLTTEFGPPISETRPFI
jgi:uracil DNA glycosylase